MGIGVRARAGSAAATRPTEAFGDREIGPEDPRSATWTPNVRSGQRAIGRILRISGRTLPWVMLGTVLLRSNGALATETLLLTGASVGAAWILSRQLDRLGRDRLARVPRSVLVAGARPDDAAAVAALLDPHDERVETAGNPPGPWLRLTSPESVSFDRVIVVDDERDVGQLLELGEWLAARVPAVDLHSKRFAALAGRAAPTRAGDDTRGTFRYRSGPSRLSWLAKRAIDLGGSFVGLVLLSPLLALIALAIRLTSPGPVLFRQTRIGRGGVPFTFLKFRTMVANASSDAHHAYVTAFVREGRAAARDAAGKEIYKLTDDDRVTRIGRVLRRTSLDELPQLVNVLRGEMSLVGPRPPIAYEWDLHDAWQRKRLDVRPGCTGLWQVTGRSRVSFEEMIILDRYYVSNWSIRGDLGLLARTVPVMLDARGGH
jgi:lipopolysaccharide/colanic/teichoic acid biosynthesis glycosyltransferase